MILRVRLAVRRLRTDISTILRVRQSPGPHETQAQQRHPRLDRRADRRGARDLATERRPTTSAANTRRSSLDRSFTVDQTSLVTAEQMIRLPTAPEERTYAQDALRIADQEMDLAFAQAVRRASSQRPLKSPEVTQLTQQLQQSPPRPGERSESGRRAHGGRREGWGGRRCNRSPIASSSQRHRWRSIRMRSTTHVRICSESAAIHKVAFNRSSPSTRRHRRRRTARGSSSHARRSEAGCCNRPTAYSRFATKQRLLDGAEEHSRLVRARIQGPARPDRGASRPASSTASTGNGLTIRRRPCSITTRGASTKKDRRPARRAHGQPARLDGHVRRVGRRSWRRRRDDARQSWPRHGPDSHHHSASAPC